MFKVKALDRSCFSGMLEQPHPFGSRSEFGFGLDAGCGKDNTMSSSTLHHVAVNTITAHSMSFLMQCNICLDFSHTNSQPLFMKPYSI